MNTTGSTGDPDGAASQSLRGLADSIETSFIEIGQSLTRKDNAASYLRTLDIFERFLQGSHAQGVIDRKQLDELADRIDDLRKVPGLL